jgi:hypothetical protein
MIINFLICRVIILIAKGIGYHCRVLLRKDFFIRTAKIRTFIRAFPQLVEAGAGLYTHTPAGIRLLAGIRCNS